VSYPVISVVTPSFNQGGFIRETIRSILDQNYPALEYIVVDGGSTDGSVDIIKDYSERLTYWVSEPDRGHGHALNKGFAKTSGEIMSWLNSDDKYLPWTFEVVAEIFSSFPEVNWIVGTNAGWDDKGRLAGAQCVYKNVYDFLLGNFAWIQQESVFWRRSLWERVGGSINEDYRLMVDGELWCRFFLADKLYAVDSIIGGYRRHSNNRGAKHQGECIAEMNRATEWLKSQCDQATLDNTRILENILTLKRNPQPRQMPLPPETLREFSSACEKAAYDRITYLNGRWEKSKVKFYACV
jgi:glycosyltransferase involved in cell wall biosynthesis